MRNPSGRNQWTERNRFKELLNTLLEEEVEVREGDSVRTMTRGEVVTRMFLEELRARRPWAMREFLRRVWPVPLEITGENGEPIPITVLDEARESLTKLLLKDRAGNGDRPPDA